MKISFDWLQDYFETKLPLPTEVANILTQHSFEIESQDKIGDDTVFDIKVLPDRSHDCLSHIGIARELASVSREPLHLKRIRDEIIQAPESNVFRVEVAEDARCKRFSALIIENVEVTESPLWLQTALSKMGARSINSVVDATNFVMYALGQPLHAYDRDMLTKTDDSWKLVVRNARDGEKVSLLGGMNGELVSGDMVIADGNAPHAPAIGIAGVKGGTYAEINTKTKNIIIEAANFDSIAIRKTSKRVGIRTDASLRFENEITPELTLRALNMIAGIIMESEGGKNATIEGLVDWYPKKAGEYKVGISLQEVHDILGVSLSNENMVATLTKRAYPFVSVVPREHIVKIASQYIGAEYKLGASVTYDAPRIFDCSSFTAYLYAQVGIAIPRVSVDQYMFGTSVSKEDLKPGDLIFSNSKDGKIHYETIEWKKGTPVPEGVDHVGVYIGDGLVIHATRKSGSVVEEQLEQSVSFKHIVGYRRCIVDESVRYVVTVPHERIDLRQKEDLVEDIGKIYGYHHIEPKSIDHDTVKSEEHAQSALHDTVRNTLYSMGFSEVITYVFRNSGERELANPLAKDKAFLRSELSSGLRDSLELNIRNAPVLNLDRIALFEIGTVFSRESESSAFAFAVKSASSKQKDEVSALINTVQIEVKKMCGDSIVFTERDGVYETLLPNAQGVSENTQPHYVGDPLGKYKKFSQYPFVLRDIAVFIPEGTESHHIVDCIQKYAGELLVSYALFDTFTKQIDGVSKTSYAYRLVFQSHEKTLTDEEVGAIMNSATTDMMNISGWQVR